MVAYSFLQSVQLLAYGCRSSTDNLLQGLEPHYKNIAKGVENSLMLVTALAPEIGYDKAAEIAKRAHNEGTTLREAALASGWVSESDYDLILSPSDMVNPD